VDQYNESPVRAKEKKVSSKEGIEQLFATSLSKSDKIMCKSSSQIFLPKNNQIINDSLGVWKKNDIIKPLYDSFNKNLYVNLFQDRIKNIREFKKYNSIYDYAKNYDEKTEYHIKYTLKSFQVHFKNLNTNYKLSLKNIDVFLPFSFIPVIYCLSEKDLIFFISHILLLNGKFSEINLISEKAINFISNYRYFHIDFFKHKNSIKFEWITENIPYEVTLK